MIVSATDMRYVPLPVTDAPPLTEETCPYFSAILLSDLPWSPLACETWFLRYYIGTDRDTRERILFDWRMTPALAPSSKVFAPAHIVTAEFNVERDEGEHYGKLLEDAGNIVSMKRYSGVPYAFALYNHPGRGLSKSREFLKGSAHLLTIKGFSEQCTTTYVLIKSGQGFPGNILTSSPST